VAKGLDVGFDEARMSGFNFGIIVHIPCGNFS
jgi:hypothetical protein